MSARLRRRDLIRGLTGISTALVLSRCAAPLANTPQAARPRKIGYLSGSSAQETVQSEPHFRQALRDLGYLEGKDIVIEVRIAENLNDRLPGLASELIGLPADILVTQGSTATLAATKATSTIPIVFIRVANPVGQGIVASLARPGGNVTGVAALMGVEAKQLELLQVVVPGLRRIAMLYNANNPTAVGQVRNAENYARTLRLDLEAFVVHSSDELDGALEAVARSRPDALVVGLGFTLARDLGQIPDFAAKLRLPAIYSTDPAFVSAGGLMASGSNTASQARRAAELVDKILKGARPADVPVEQTTGFDFILNLSAAQRIGLTIPESVMRQATEVIR